MWYGSRYWKEYIIWWRVWHQCPLTLVDSEPQDRHGHSPNWVTAGKAKEGGGVNWVSTPQCQEEGQAYVYPHDAEYSHPQDKGPSPPVEGWLPTLYWRWWRTVVNKETRTDSQSTGCAHQKVGEGDYETPQVQPGTLGGKVLKLAPPQNLNCNRQHCYLLTRKDWDGQYCCHIFYLHRVWKSVLSVSLLLLVYIVGYY